MRSKWQKRLSRLLPGKLGGGLPGSDRKRLHQLIRSQLANFLGPESLSDDFEKQILSSLHTRQNLLAKLTELPAEKVLENVTVKGTEELPKDAGPLGYVLVFIQPFAKEILQKLVQANSPLVHALFEGHEDPSSHIPLLNKANGLAFAFDFYPDHHEAILTDFFDQLHCVSTKAVAFSGLTQTPIHPLWFEVSGGQLQIRVLPKMSLRGTIPQRARRLLSVYANLIRQSPEGIDWITPPWHPPVRRFLTNRRNVPLHLGKEISLDQLDPFRLLVRTPDDIREACLAIPALRALKLGRPDISLCVLSTPELVPLWKQMDEIDTVLQPTDQTSRTFNLGIALGSESHAAEELRRFPIDRIAGMDGTPYEEALDETLPSPRKLGPPEHRQRRYLRIPHRLGAEVEGIAELFKPLRSSPRHAGAPIIAIAPDSEHGESYVWPRERFAQLVPTSSQINPGVIWHILLTQEDEQQMAFWNAFKKSRSDIPIEIKIHQLKIGHLIELLNPLSALIANDNATLHLGAALGIPSIGIFGPSDPVVFAPIGTHTAIVRHHVECSPCSLPECPLDHRCMESIHPSEVLESLQTTLLKQHENPY